MVMSVAVVEDSESEFSVKVKNIIEQCKDGKGKQREIEEIYILAIHRIFFDDVDEDALLTPEVIANRFIYDPEVAKYTGGEVPYTFMIDQTGAIHQCLTLCEVGPHARRWNSSALGIGVIGDFRKKPPTPGQRAALVDLCANLCLAFDLDPLGDTEIFDPTNPEPQKYQRKPSIVKSLSGHSELPSGSRDPKKQCPGKFLPMDQLRFDVNDAIRRSAMASLLRGGIVA